MGISVARFAVSASLVIAAAGCSSASGSNFLGDGGTSVLGFDATHSGSSNIISGGGSTSMDAGIVLMGPPTGPEGGPTADAFFAMDPPPKYCGIDGGMAPPTPGGTVDCPSDKNRAGCPCPTAGMTAACWPGLRVDRGVGVCKDGTTTCVSTDEGLMTVWGDCVGAVLPTEGATSGAAACKCFSSGEWNIANLEPCFITYDPGGTYAVSSYQADGGIACPMGPDTPPPTPQPGVPWSTDTLKVDCAGHYKLCFTIKAGSATSPQSTDCVVGSSCTTGDYATASAVQTFPPLPGWANMDPTCAAKFVASGGYGEMTVQGQSERCEGIGDNDGGAPEVFNRVPYCAAMCQTNPNAAGCANCQAAGSGGFGG